MLSLGIVVERFCFELGGSGPQGRILVERRNERLDHELTVAWDVLRLNGTRYVRPEVLRRRIAALEFATKATGGAGLEIADLVVTPLGRWVAGMPTKPDLDIVRSKLRRGPKGTGKAPGSSFCQKKVAGDRYAIPDQGQCRFEPSSCQSTHG